MNSTTPADASQSLLAASRAEPMAVSPLWLSVSGLPELLNTKVNRSAWLIFKTVIEMDCERNTRPGTVEVPPAEIAERCGLPADAVMRTLEGLRRRKCLALFLPDHPEDTALVEVKIPLPTPRSPEEVRQRFPFNRLEPGVPLRYASARPAEDVPRGPRETAESRVQRVVDLYFNVVGFKMNSFILDELRLVCERFEPALVEKTFSRAARNDIRSLAWVVQELYRQTRKDDRGKT